MKKKNREILTALHRKPLSQKWSKKNIQAPAYNGARTVNEITNFLCET